MGVSEPALRANGIGVAFAGVWVLSDVSVDILPGEIHGLIGENGAGKSTLGKVFGGYYASSAGTLDVFGERASAWDPLMALSKGVAIMHQELQLVPALTVAENVFPRPGGAALGRAAPNRGGAPLGTDGGERLSARSQRHRLPPPHRRPAEDRDLAGTGAQWRESS